MKDRDRPFLGHVLSAIDAIASFTVEGQSAFMADRKTQSALIRQIEITDEAVKDLSADLTASETAVPWRQIAGTRDRRYTPASAWNSILNGPWWSQICRNRGT